MEKIDFVKENKELYGPSSKEPVIVEVPTMNFIMVDGHGDPNTSEKYKQAIEALYSLAYTIKFMPKKGISIPGYFEHKVCPLEGLWWMKNNSDFGLQDKQNWDWTMMIRVPDFVTESLVEQATKIASKKKENPALDFIRFEKYDEGTSVQIMHIGPYSTEHPNIMRMHEFALNEGYKLHGKHHEIYFGDPRKTKPEKLKTILRQPVVHTLGVSTTL
jgi:hypothetical protein